MLTISPNFRASRESYGEDAIGYVCVKSVGCIVTIKGKATPEHKVNQAPYDVYAIVDSKDKTIMDAGCLGCKAQKGGCKHAIACVFWLLRRSEEKSVTDVKCYWKKARLSSMKNLSPFQVSSGERNADAGPTVDEEAFRQEAFAMLLNKGYSEKAQAVKLTGTTNKCGQNVYTDMLVVKYVQEVGTENVSLEGFRKFCKSAISQDDCAMVENMTRDQKNSPLWHHVRFGRVTASRLHEVSHCSTVRGSLVESMLGASKFTGTAATKRGVLLEGQVLGEVERKLGVKCSPAGIHISRDWAVFGASPDAVVVDSRGKVVAVVEVKCPASAQTVCAYLDPATGEIRPKCRAQLQLQMLLTGCRKGFFCVAAVDFETNRQVTVTEDELSEEFLAPLMERAQTFWYRAVFPMLARGSDSSQ